MYNLIHRSNQMPARNSKPEISPFCRSALTVDPVDQAHSRLCKPSSNLPHRCISRLQTRRCWPQTIPQDLRLRKCARLHTTEVVFGPSAYAGPGAGASLRDLIAVELLSETAGTPTTRSGFDDTCESPPFHRPTTTEDLTVCPWQNLNALIQHTRTMGIFLHIFRSLRLAFNTGTVKPAVLPKRVPRVRVRSRFLAHRDTPRTRAAVSRVPTGLM
jgi:hypothetical protein